VGQGGFTPQSVPAVARFATIVATRQAGSGFYAYGSAAQLILPRRPDAQTEETNRDDCSRNEQSAPLVDSYARGATDVPLIEQTIGAFFADMVARQPEREALVSVHQGCATPMPQLQTEAHRLASALLGLGLVPGDRVGIWSHNNAEWVLMQLATAQVGLVLVNINPAYRAAHAAGHRPDQHPVHQRHHRATPRARR
jgi:non-ribosomal peptide synthetase component F